MAIDKKRAMGRGLSAILSENSKKVNSAEEKGAEELVGNILEISLDDIITNPNQPRTNFDQKALDELSISIKQLGLIQPITVRKNGDKFDLISGERRYRASKQAGLKKLPAFVRLANDQELLEMALVENIQRKDLDPIEIALSFEKLIEEINITQENLSNRVGKDRSTITNYLRLLKLSPIIQTGIRDGIISMGHGRALISLEEQEKQLFVYEKIVREQLSVRQTESFIRTFKNPKSKKVSKEKELPNHLKKGLKNFEDYFETTIEIKATEKGKGKIIINFDSTEEFERIQKLLE
ncbi:MULTISPECIES: ParB/RepB/Spo0J family partition protein [Apibacter]|uniref:ParB/RepB/Spo0J family partition protein n=1 Tax=Apibacter TaxID=1778601 RepID=UPI000CF92EEC|nr:MULTISPECIES: ParB/RepB/Spo0J family partition protein [Apibacter]MCX8676317.1 ParB/RepB/Spo0J family partition protein [Apibacter sp. B3919]MXO23782.1 ParB/RepB/Spo0J family partition protein [Apibacter sp. B3924]MXO26540.1 ParB/RepB/Spo0J family partition protein [Apibacter sp. B3813]MXO28492.1 ParB/RepB/Spo0J family partition protein [Apibacter sp. B3913]MXO30446.1 ParB/RepB/Spo0J family partition protein [Apibacter sp. B3912]